MHNALAIPVPVDNNSFENPSLTGGSPPGNYTLVAPPDWALTTVGGGSSGGVWNPLPSISGQDGNNVAWIVDNGILGQWLMATSPSGSNPLAANTTYMLTADVASRNDLPGGTYQLALVAGDPLGNTGPSAHGKILYESDPLTPSATLTQEKISYTVLASDLGGGYNTLGIWLVANQPGTPNTIILFDNVSVNATAAVPEPMTLLLLGSGLVGLAAMRRRIKK